jgi:UDP-3-O-[3-hydroxymyristoyl] glucosamine N-acyltransferase
MPEELPPLPFGNIAKYKLARKGSGLSDEELLEEQAGLERRIAKEAALRGVTLIGAAVVKQRNAAAASLRERAAAVSSAVAVSSAAAVSADAAVSSADSVSADASVSAAASVSSAAAVSSDASVSAAASVSADASLRERSAAYSSRGRPLRERKRWAEDDD